MRRTRSEPSRCTRSSAHPACHVGERRSRRHRPLPDLREPTTRACPFLVDDLEITPANRGGSASVFALAIRRPNENPLKLITTGYYGLGRARTPAIPPWL